MDNDTPVEEIQPTETPGSVPGTAEEPVVETKEGGEPTPVAKPGAPSAEDELKRQRKEQRRLREENQRLKEQAAYERGLREGMIKPASGTPVAASEDKPPEKPDPDKFEGGQYSREYLEAMADYSSDLAVYKTGQKQKEADQKKAQDDGNKTLMENFNAFKSRVARAAEEFDDPEIAECLERNDASNPFHVDARVYPTAPAVVLFIMESELAPRLIRHFLDNRAELETIYKSATPAAAMAKMARVEAKLEAETKPDQTKMKSGAPKPITPIPGTPAPGSATKIEPEDMSVGDYFHHYMTKFYGGGAAA
jgi:hypothetical protein